MTRVDSSRYVFICIPHINPRTSEGFTLDHNLVTRWVTRAPPNSHDTIDAIAKINAGPRQSLPLNAKNRRESQKFCWSVLPTGYIIVDPQKPRIARYDRYVRSTPYTMSRRIDLEPYADIITEQWYLRSAVSSN